ncbi:MAG: hypothetical protein KDI09_02625 [Halioglobus sp.]|nr:hypothetical protein [Halioglobus sp.]
MNIYLIAGMLLASVTLAGHAGETGAPSAPADAISTAGDAVTLESGNADTTQARFGTSITDAVMLDISSRVADALTARMAIELDAREAPDAARTNALLVSTN